MARILIIDDEELIRLMISQVLERDGHSVVEAADGAEGLAALRDGSVDLVITDILMPNKEGIETITEIRASRPGLKIIAMSGGGRIQATSYLDFARNAGADVMLKKPVEIKDLRSAIAQCLGPAAGPDPAA